LIRLRTAAGAWRRDRLLRNNLVFFTGGLAAGLLGYVFHFVTGRLLGPGGYSLVAAALAALYLLTLPGLAAQLVAARFVGLATGRGDAAGVRLMVRRLNVASLAFGATLAAALLLFRAQVLAYLHVGDPVVVYILAATTAVLLMVAVNRGALQGQSRFVSLSGNVVLDMGSRVLMAGVLAAFGIGALAGLAALFLGPLVAYLHSLLLFRGPSGEGRATTAPSLPEIARYAVFAALGTGGVTYLFNADVLLAKHFLSADAAGIYAAGSVLGRAVYFLGLTVATVMFPEVTALHARDEAHFHVMDRSLLLLGLIAVGLVSIYTLVPRLVLLPYGSGFTGVAPYLGPFALALSLLAVANLLINYFLSLDSRRFVLPLLGACVLETALISTFHGSVTQILEMLLGSMAGLCLTLAALYLADRLRPARGGEAR
jgi:O-antigen/teichoic acid export membrane protein